MLPIYICLGEPILCRIPLQEIDFILQSDESFRPWNIHLKTMRIKYTLYTIYCKNGSFYDIWCISNEIKEDIKYYNIKLKY
jgi:hypothetical protein